jgi:hypothetical protein
VPGDAHEDVIKVVGVLKGQVKEKEAGVVPCGGDGVGDGVERIPCPPNFPFSLSSNFYALLSSRWPRGPGSKLIRR